MRHLVDDTEENKQQDNPDLNPDLNPILPSFAATRDDDIVGRKLISIDTYDNAAIDERRMRNLELYGHSRPLLWKNMPLYPSPQERRAAQHLNDQPIPNTFGLVDTKTSTVFGWDTLEELLMIMPDEPFTYKWFLRAIEDGLVVVFNEEAADEFKKNLEKEFNTEYDYNKKEAQKKVYRAQPKVLQPSKPGELSYYTDDNQTSSMVWGDDER